MFYNTLFQRWRTLWHNDLLRPQPVNTENQLPGTLTSRGYTSIVVRFLTTDSRCWWERGHINLIPAPYPRNLRKLAPGMSIYSKEKSCLLNRRKHVAGEPAQSVNAWRPEFKLQNPDKTSQGEGHALIILVLKKQHRFPWACWLVSLA